MVLENFIDPCNNSYYRDLTIRTTFVVYYVVTPCYFFLGLFGHTLSLLAYFRRAKTEKAYVYQIMVTVSALLAVFVTTFYTATFVWWPGITQSEAAGWYTSCYACMWVSAHLSVPLMNAFDTTTRLLSICMAHDRFQALRKQQQYKEASKSRHICTALACFATGFASTAFQCFIFEVVPEASGGYTIVTTPFIASTLNISLALVRNGIALVSLCALYFFSFAIPWLYFKNLKEAQNVISTAAEDRRRQGAIMLTKLCLSESILATVSGTVAIAFYVSIGLPPSACVQIQLFATVMDCTMEITSILNFYVMFFLNQRFRRMIVTMVKTWFNSVTGTHGSSAVAPAPPTVQHLDALRTPRSSYPYVGTIAWHS